MSNHPPNVNHGNVDGSGGDWRQQPQPPILGSNDPDPIQPPPLVGRDPLPLPPPHPQQHQAPVYHNQAMLRQQAVSPASLNQPQQQQVFHRSPFHGSNLIDNISANRQNNFGPTLNGEPSNNLQGTTGVDIGNALDPEEQLGGDDNALVSGIFQTSVSGWSNVDASGGGIPPSARSLHSAALLNGVMYVFGRFHSRHLEVIGKNLLTCLVFRQGDTMVTSVSTLSTHIHSQRSDGHQ